MPTLSSRLEPAGAVVDLEIGWSAGGVRTQRAALRPVPPSIHARGLIDSGAEASCVDSRLINALGLSLLSYKLVNLAAAGGITVGAEYEVGVAIKHPSGDVRRDFIVPDLTVIELPLRGLGLDVLLGRDVLGLCRFLYDGPKNRFRLTY